MTFSDQLEFGKAAESAIARWLIRRGCSVLPVYEKIISDGKGPQLFTATGNLVAPDLFVFTQKSACWIEAKHKTAFTWHRITRRFVTGIDLNHYSDYCKISESVNFPVWLMFLHRGGQAKDSEPSPSGLFGESLNFLMTVENHRHTNHGRHGMVYWDIDRLRKFAEYTEVVIDKAK